MLRQPLWQAVSKAIKQEEQAAEDYKNQVEPPIGKMTYRENPKTKEKVSLLGYGMMRLPTKVDNSDEYDQEMINKQVDYAIEHGVNYFDTSPVYCQGKSEHCTGIALSRHKRSEYYVATKLSNFNRDYWSAEKSKEMYHNSMKELQVDYIDYYLLHAVGGSMEEFKGRYVDNGMMDYLLKEREAGRIRNLGFSFHGMKSVFDEVLALHDQYHWDFVQIELNYLDWDFADEMSNRNVDASYLYEELKKRGIPAVVMEPLLGGRLANLPQYLVNEMKKFDPTKSVASWAFRYAGTYEGVLTVLDCKYCMPCPYGIDIPAIFVHYNKCKNEGSLPMGVGDKEYREHRRQYLISLDRVVPRERQPDHCIGCHQCEPHCPQSIRITRELHKISDMIEQLKRNPIG